MKNRNFLKHFAVIGSGTILSMLLSLLTTPIITRIVAPAEYGQLSIFTTYSAIAVSVLCLGHDQALVRYYYEDDSNMYKSALLFKCIALPIVISIIISCIFSVLTAKKILIFEFDTLIVIMLCIYTIIQVIYRFSLLLVRLAYKSKLYSIINVLYKIIYIAAALPLILFRDKNHLLSLITATILAVTICMIVSICAQANLWKFKKRNVVKCNVSCKEILRYGYPFVISTGIASLLQAIDKMALNKYCSYEEVGIYSAAMTLVNIFAIIQSTFNTLWAPMAMEHYTKDKNDKKFYQKGNQVITIVMFFLGISLILFKDIFAFLLGEKYRAAASIVPFLIFHPIMYTISETTVSGLVFMKKSKAQIIVAIGACLANIVGNTVLVPYYGGKGAAISTGISYIVFFTLRTLLSNKYFYVDFKLVKFYLLTGIVGIYALYNTFISFNYVTIIGYVICIWVLLALYWNEVKWCMNYLTNILKDIPVIQSIGRKLFNNNLR